MNTLSIEFLGPEFVLLLAALWTVAMVVALAVAWWRRTLIHRSRLVGGVARGPRTIQ